MGREVVMELVGRELDVVLLGVGGGLLCGGEVGQSPGVRQSVQPPQSLSRLVRVCWAAAVAVPRRTVRHTLVVLTLPLTVAASPTGTFWQDWVPLISVGISAGAFILSLLNRRTANRALRISLAQEERRIARLDLQLMEQASYRPKGADYRWVLAQVLIINRSDRDGSIIRAELKVGYLTGADIRVDTHIPHTILPNQTQIGVEPLQIPVPVKANDAKSGWFTFKINDSLVQPNRVDEYAMLVYDSRGPIESAQLWAMREIFDEAEEEADRTSKANES
jgi:hypothetical protein